MSTVDPSNEEITATITLAGELNKSVKDVSTHAKDALKSGHSDIMGTLPQMKYYNDPTGHPEVKDDPLYDKYVLIRRLYAASYLAAILGKNIKKAKELSEFAEKQLMKLKDDYHNLIITGTDTGITDSAGSIATVKSSKKSFPVNPNAQRFRPVTMNNSNFAFPDT